MKIRIKGPSVRLRLSKSEVATLLLKGSVIEETPFGNKSLRYAVQKTDSGSALSATFMGDAITMYVPQQLIQNWDTNSLITIDAHIPLGSGGSLYLLLEKDFQCIDQTTEDQSDNYINPSKNC